MNWDDDSGWVYEDEDTRFNTVDEDRDDDALDPDDEDLYDSDERMGAWGDFCNEDSDDDSHDELD